MHALMAPTDILQIIAMAAVWGGSFLFLRIATPDFGPVPLIAIRVAISALFLLPVLLLRPAWRAEFRQNVGKLCLLGVTNAAIPFPLFAYSTLFVTAGFASIINATAPLFAAVVAGIWLRDRLTTGGFLGLIVGFGGVVLLVGGLPDAPPGTLPAIGGSLFAAFLYGVSASFVKKHLAGVNAWVTTIGSFGFAALLLAPLAVVTWPAVPPSAASWTAVLLLAVVCTAIPNIYYFRLLLRVGPGKAMSVAFLIPVFGTLWGAVVLGEKVTPAMLGGGAVVLLGTALVVGVIGRRLGGVPAAG
jgi:drug/metabolite transporter (DMT)-like permease